MDNDNCFYIPEKKKRIELTIGGKYFVVFGSIIILMYLTVIISLRTPHEPYITYGTYKELEKKVPKNIILPDDNIFMFDKGSIQTEYPNINEFLAYSMRSNRKYMGVDVYLGARGGIYPAKELPMDLLVLTYKETNIIKMQNSYEIDTNTTKNDYDCKYTIEYTFYIDKMYYMVDGRFYIRKADYKENEIDEILSVLDDWLIQVYESMIDQK